MRLITIDNGNTNQTVAIHEKGKIKNVLTLSDYRPTEEDFILISSVGQNLSLQPSFDLKQKRTEKSFFDMPVDYAMSLGEDRMVAAYGIFKNLVANEKVLLIDAGTFITCDLITSKGFLGGYIFPGVERFLKSYSDSAQLPHLGVKEFENTLNNPVSIPHQTDEAILMATRIYLESLLDEMIKKHSPGKIIITGGSAQDMGKLISSEVRFELDHHLVHSALCKIYDLHLRSNF